ncbi:MAG: hypothetical protein M1829_001531 [Trizodia sp. TS-e1964]|nr:MAG: hypothetical protein M1829_001531 [Trizodia sp. TS-e1964]
MPSRARAVTLVVKGGLWQASSFISLRRARIAEEKVDADAYQVINNNGKALNNLRRYTVQALAQGPLAITSSQPGMPQKSDFVPTQWTIELEDANGTSCPSARTILGLFATVNVVVCLFSILTGHSKLVRGLSCGLMGRNETTSWLFTWIIPVALQLGGNALIAYMIQQTPGYKSSFAIWELMLFLCARPRLSWFALAVLHLCMRGSGSRAKKVAYRTAYFSTLAAEFVLQTLSLYVMGLTASFAAGRGYLTIGSAPYKSLPASGRMMYGAAVYYLVFGCMNGILTTLLIWMPGFVAVEKIARARWLTQRFPSFARALNPTDDAAPFEFDYSDDDYLTMTFAASILVTTWLASWLFWAGFVQVAAGR